MPNMLRRWEAEYNPKTGEEKLFEFPNENETEFPAVTYRREVPMRPKVKASLALASLPKMKKKNALINNEEID